MRRAVSSGAILLAMTALALPVLFATAIAQQQSNVTTPSESSGLEEIVVTAQRRAQDILTVPMAITATSGAELEKNGIRNFDELQFITPGYLATDIAGATEIYIRGVGNNVDIGADPSIALFIDDVPRIFGQMFNQFADVERIEILKGAQGGLYGRNATGGVINVITRQPNTDQTEGRAEVSYGQKSTLTVGGFLNVPVNDRLAWSVAGEHDAHDPYTLNLFATKTPYTAAMFPTGSYLGTPQQTADFFNSGVHPIDDRPGQPGSVVGGR